MRYRYVVAVATLVGGFGETACGQVVDQTELRELVEKAEKVVLSTDSPAQAGAAYTALFEQGTPAELDRVASAMGLGMRVQQLWEQHERTHDAAEPILAHLREASLTAPAYWEMNLLLRSCPNPRQYILDEGAIRERFRPFYEAERHRTGVSYITGYPPLHVSGKLLVPPDVSIEQHSNSMVIHRENRKLTIRGTALESVAAAREHRRRCNVNLGEKSSVLVFYNDGGDRFPLICLDTASGTVLWTTQIWAGNSDDVRGRSGVWTNDVELVRGDDSIAVFGTTGKRLYMEVFSITDARSIARFSTDLWRYTRGDESRDTQELE